MRIRRMTFPELASLALLAGLAVTLLVLPVFVLTSPRSRRAPEAHAASLGDSSPDALDHDSRDPSFDS